MSDACPEPFRRRRVLLALGPFAGALGMFLGAAAKLDGHLSLEDLGGLGLVATFLGAVVTLMAVEIGYLRGQPLHALKACATIAVLLFFPGMLLGVAIAASGC